MKVYAVYFIPKSPEYILDRIFTTKEMAKKYIKEKKEKISLCGKNDFIYDIQLEEVY